MRFEKCYSMGHNVSYHLTKHRWMIGILADDACEDRLICSRVLSFGRNNIKMRELFQCARIQIEKALIILFFKGIHKIFLSYIKEYAMTLNSSKTMLFVSRHRNNPQDTFCIVMTQLSKINKGNDGNKGALCEDVQSAFVSDCCNHLLSDLSLCSAQPHRQFSAVDKCIDISAPIGCLRRRRVRRRTVTSSRLTKVCCEVMLTHFRFFDGKHLKKPITLFWKIFVSLFRFS